MMNRGIDLGTISKGILSHSNFQHTAVYCQTIPETVEIAVQDRSRFVLGGGGADVKAPVPVPAQEGRLPHARDEGGMARVRCLSGPAIAWPCGAI